MTLESASLLYKIGKLMRELPLRVDWKKKLLRRVDRFDNSYESLIFLLDQFTLNFPTPLTNWEVRLLSPTIKSIYFTILQLKKILQQIQNKQMKIIINWDIFYIINNNICCILDMLGICQKPTTANFIRNLKFSKFYLIVMLLYLYCNCRVFLSYFYIFI